MATDMLAAVLEEHGGVDRLQVRRYPRPVPEEGEVLVRVRACALNNTDVLMRAGAYGTPGDPHAAAGWQQKPIQFPRIPGVDVAGDIVEAGAGIDSAREEERVVLFPFRRVPGDHPGMLGSEFDGGYAEYVRWPAELCFPSPVDDPLQAAGVVTAGLTAMELAEQARIRQGDAVLVTGATGGVGTFAVQLVAHHYNARVIALVRNPAFADELKALGAEQVLVASDDDFVEEAQRIVGGPLDAVLDVVGGPVVERATQMLKPLGRLAIAGSSGGRFAQLDTRALYVRRIELLGSMITRNELYDFHRGLFEDQLLPALGCGEIRTLVDRVFPLSEVQQAQTHFEQSRGLGKVLLTPDGDR